MFDFLHLRRSPSARAHRAAYGAHRSAWNASQHAQAAGALATTARDGGKCLRDILAAADTTALAISTAARGGPVGTQMPDDLRRLLKDARKHAGRMAADIGSAAQHARIAELAAADAADRAADASEHAQEASEQKDLPEDARKQEIAARRQEREKKECRAP